MSAPLRITVYDYESAQRRIAQLEHAINIAADELSDFLLTNTKEDEFWEEAYPEVDLARTTLLEVLA